MTDEVGFEIGGRTYPVPELDSFTMDEAQLLFDYAGVAIEDFALADPDASEGERARHEERMIDKVRNPAFKRALVEIAYQRGNPKTSRADVRELISGVNMLEVLAGFADAENAEGDDASPPDEPESTPPPSEQSSSEPDDSKPSFGDDSSITSDVPDEPLASIGAMRSDT